MLTLTLKPYPGDLVWHAIDAPEAVLSLPALWGAATGTFKPDRASLKSFVRHTSPFVQATGSSIHGRSCYLGQCSSGRFLFAKGVGWVHSAGWQPDHGNSGIVPHWAAEHERDFTLRFTELGVATVRPEAIIAHQTIPDANGGSPRKPEEVPDLDGKPAMPCMYVYSSTSRWRLADLYYLTECQRRHLLGNGRERREWLRHLLMTIGQSSRLLHQVGGNDYSLSPHNVFCDGTRVDFEYSYLPEMPHPNPALNTDASVWQAKERDGLRELAWQVAELLRIDATTAEVTQWWQSAYEKTAATIRPK